MDAQQQEQQKSNRYPCNYRGRVRSGCLTCRSRKVKCDEGRPICTNCTRLKRHCVYKPNRKDHPNPRSSSSSTLQKDSQDEISNPNPNPSGTTEQSSEITGLESTSGSALGSASQDDLHVRLESQDDIWANIRHLDRSDEKSWREPTNQFQYADTSTLDVTVHHHERISVTPGDAEEAAFEKVSPATLISRDIELTTTIDILTTQEILPEPSFSFFVEEVDCPCVTPYDATNWQRMKTIVVEIGKSNQVVASAIMALSMVYKAQLYGLPSSKALSLYHSAKGMYDKTLNDITHDFEVVLVATFLLCLFEFIDYEIAPILKEHADIFVSRLETWREHELPHTELSMRIIVWLRLLYAATIRGGGMGLFSESVYRALPNYDTRIPSLKCALNHHEDASIHLYDMLSAPIFEFYFQLQMMSSEIARETHYHRSRTTGMDQEAVVQNIALIKSRLLTLWETRSAAQQQKPDDLRSCLAPNIANPIITLIGLCNAAYHAEFVEIHRVLGDPVSKSAESKYAMRQIREIVDGDWNAYSKNSSSFSSSGNNNNNSNKLNPGYLRPLFLYAIECMDSVENQWAVDRLNQIKDPICRGDFFAMFGKALGDAQLRKDRRVTSSYFCFWYFGVPPPFM